jgi:hypothetical protein
VQAIIRNEQIYREIDQEGGASNLASSQAAGAGGAH